MTIIQIQGPEFHSLKNGDKLYSVKEDKIFYICELYHNRMILSDNQFSKDHTSYLECSDYLSNNYILLREIELCQE